MNIQDWASLLIQIPLVAVFIWYSLEMNKRYMAAQDRRDEAYVSAMGEMTRQLQSHDEQARMIGIKAETSHDVAKEILTGVNLLVRIVPRNIEMRTRKEDS